MALHLLETPLQELESTVLSAADSITVAECQRLEADTSPEIERGRAIHRLNGLYRSALTDDRLHVALAAQKELNKLLGLYSVPSSEDGMVCVAAIKEIFDGILGAIEERLGEAIAESADGILRCETVPELRMLMGGIVRQCVADAVAEFEDEAGGGEDGD